MGNTITTEPPPPVVLVPPILGGPHLAVRSRMVKSSYDVLFSKIAREHLFADYYRDAEHLMTRIMLKPSEDPNVDFIATIIAPVEEGLGKLEGKLEGDAEFRWQRDAVDPNTFIELKISTSNKALAVQACTFDPVAGIGSFAKFPLRSNFSSTPEGRPTLGFRYGSSNLSIGTTIDAFYTDPLSFWYVRRQGKITAGFQYIPHELKGHRCEDHGAAIQNLKNWSFALDYGNGRNSPLNPSFNFCVEIYRHSKLIASYYHRLIVQRQVRNPFEEDRVVAITNYIDLGIEFQQSIGRWKEDIGDKLQSIQIGASWQANKNILFKAKFGTHSSGVALIFKSWWQPSFTISSAVVRDHVQKQTKVGMGLQVENFGDARYERADPNYVMVTPTKEHIAKDLKHTKQRRSLQHCPSDIII